MRTTFLVFIAIAVLLFTISAFSLAIIKASIIFLPFGILGLILVFVFRKKLKTI